MALFKDKFGYVEIKKQILKFPNMKKANEAAVEQALKDNRITNTQESNLIELIYSTDCSLKSTEKELISLFPRKLNGLKVFFVENAQDTLKVIFIQKNTPDPMCDWDKFEKYMIECDNAKNKDEMFRIKSQFPEGVDQIFGNQCSPEFLLKALKSGKIQKNDRVLLFLNLLRYDYMKKDEVSLGRIQRNRSSDLKGIGEEFYHNLLLWLKKRGYKFLIGLPETDFLGAYWKKMGQVPYKTLDENYKKHIQLEKEGRETSYVHIL